MLPVKTNLLPTVSRFFEDDWNNIFDWSNRNFSNNSSTLPSVNIEEDKDNFVVQVAAPGMKKEHFNIELNNNTLVIKGERKVEEKEKKDNIYVRREFNYNSFHREFNLNPQVVDTQVIDAQYNDGVLCIKIAKKEEAKEKPARKIAIK